MRFGFIFNPAATGYRVGVEEVIRARFPDAEFYRTECAGEAGRLATRCSERHPDEDVVLVACGGDGTFREVAERQGEHRRLGIVPLGTVNLVATELGIPPDLEGAVRVLEAGRTILIYPGLCVLDDEGPARPFFIGASAGPDADAVHTVSLRLKRAIGGAAYGLSAARRVLSAVRAEIVLTVEGRSAQVGVVVVLRMARYGGWFTLGTVSLREPILEAVAVGEGRRAALGLFWNALRGGGRLPTFAQRFVAREMSLRLPGNGRLQLDGDPFRAREARLSCATRPVRVIGDPETSETR